MKIRSALTVSTLALRPSFWKQVLNAVDNRGWWAIIRESYSGAWQQNIEVDANSVLAFHAVFACITLIAADIGKLRARLVERDDNDIWTETNSAAFSPVLRKPNHYQNHIQFKEWWMISKLSRGNTYVLKERDNRGVVVRLYLLDPMRVIPLVTDEGDVYYQLSPDNLSGLTEASVVVPASEIIHDRFNCLFHPLVGLSPIFACGLAATQGLKIQNTSAKFFANAQRPGGVLTAPGSIGKETAERLKAEWESKFSGENVGKVAVLGDGLKFEGMVATAEESQLIEQLKMTAEIVCSTFHMPPFKIGVGAMPTYQNGELFNQIYYTDCLQSHIESFELCMDEGLGLDFAKDGKVLGVDLDLDGLLRMDTATKINTMAAAVNGSIFTTDEARAKLDKKPVKGGDTIWRQQQYYSLAALAKRDEQDPFAKLPAPALPAPEEEEQSEEEKMMPWLKEFSDAIMVGLPAAVSFEAV